MTETQEERDRLPRKEISVNAPPLKEAATLNLTAIGTFNNLPLIAAIVHDAKEGVSIVYKGDRGQIIVSLAMLLRSLAQEEFLGNGKPPEEKLLITPPEKSLRL